MRVPRGWQILCGAATLVVAGMAGVPRLRADETPKTTTAGDSAKAVNVAAPGMAFAWKDVAGNAYGSDRFGQNKATVFVWVSSQCPVANAYSSRLAALHTRYRNRGVGFFLVDSNREDTQVALRHYVKERGIVFPAIKDDGCLLADRLGASRTPEAVIVDAQGTVRYRGGIDDNASADKATHSYVGDALDALLTGQPIIRPRVLPIGCTIFRDTLPTAKTTGLQTATYARDIAPILNQNCVVCHRTGEVGPFALQTYQQARTWASAIRDYTARRLMPPWKAEPGWGDFHDARRLTDAQIALVARWADGGAPQGKIADTPPAPAFSPAADWTLPRPDVVCQPDRDYHLEADGKDVYREYVMPQTFKEDRWINGWEFKAGNRAVVHHIILYLDPKGEALKLDGKEKEPGYSVPGGDIGVKDDIWVAGWAPGNTPHLLPPGTAVRLPAGARIVMQVHYHKDGKPEIDRSQLALHFADPAAIKQEMITAPIANFWFRLKPGQAHQEVKLDFPLPINVHAWAIMPHMHNLGREMKVVATLPDGKTVPMVWVNDWDFNWQETYRYKEPLALPKGTKISLTAYYDNTEQNPRQGLHPPKEVGWGEQTTDEMCIVFVQITVDGRTVTPAKTAAR